MSKPKILDLPIEKLKEIAQAIIQRLTEIKIKMIRFQLIYLLGSLK